MLLGPVLYSFNIVGEEVVVYKLADFLVNFPFLNFAKIILLASLGTFMGIIDTARVIDLPTKLQTKFYDRLPSNKIVEF